MRAAARRVVLRLQHSGNVAGLDSGRVGRNVEERGRAAALRHAERVVGGSGPRATATSTRWPAGRLLLLFVRASVLACLARSVLFLATHAKGELGRPANNPPRRVARVTGAY
jgi:hypothetical protein